MDHRYRKFLAVAETGSFSEAAKKLRVTQPAITLAIASLERAFGTKLYIRKKYAVELTNQGKIVALSSKKIAAEIDKMKIELAKASATKQFQIGIIDSIAHLLYASQDTSLLSNIEVMVDNSKRIIAEVLADKIDIGVITGQPIALSKEVSTYKVQDEEFVFVCAPFLAPASSVSKIDDWLAINQDSTSYRHFVKLFKKEKLEVGAVFYSTSMELLKEMAVAGKGTALLPRHLVRQSLDNGTLEVVHTKPMYRPIWVVSRKDIDQPDVQKFISQLNTLLLSK
jgi:DNA-binding transcriptional LysR family regulator